MGSLILSALQRKAKVDSISPMCSGRRRPSPTKGVGIHVGAAPREHLGLRVSVASRHRFDGIAAVSYAPILVTLTRWM